MARVGTTRTNVRKGNPVTETLDRTSLHGKLSGKDSTGKGRVVLPHSHPDLPRASSRINELLYNQAPHTTAGPEQHPCTDNRHFKCKASCCSSCQYCTRAITKERFKSRASKLSLQRIQIKICEKCFWCHSIVLCPSCYKCTKCCPQSSCRGQTSELLENLAGPRYRSKSGSNPQRGLHPPISDPTETSKISNRHKLLWQSPEEQLPAGGITSAYRQKCSRVSKKPVISELFQQIVSSPQTQQSVETDLGSEQPEFLPQVGEIQNGDPGNHQDIPPTGRVDHLHRLQGCILPHPNTGTVQEISEISCPRPNLPVQSPTIRAFDSTTGVYCNSKGGQTDGHTQGYKDPPVPRRLVGESRILPSLSPTHTRTSTVMPEVRLDSKLGKVRTGAQTNLQFHRLPIRPEGRLGPAHTGPVADPPRENLGDPVSTDLSGPAVYVPDWSANSHRKASFPRPASHETHTVASQKQLESAGSTGKGHSGTQIPPRPFGMVVGRKQYTARSTTAPIKTRTANLYRRVQGRVGCSSWRTYHKRFLVGTREQTPHKLSGVKGSLSSSQGVPACLYGQNCPGGHGQYNSGSLHQQGGGHAVRPTLCPSMENLDLVYHHQITLKARHIPGHLNVIDKLSRLGQTIQTEWSLLPEVFQQICNQWHRPQIDLFATRFNHKLPQFLSPVPDSLAVAVDALTLPWEDLDAYAFPPTAILGKVVAKLLDSPCKRIIMIALGWPNMPWFWDLVTMSSQVPLSLPNLPNLLTQPFNHIPLRNLTNLNLHAWLLEPQKSKNRASLRQWQQGLKLLKEDLPDQSMRQSGPFLQSGASLIRWTSGHHL